MKEFLVIGDTLPEAYHNALLILRCNGSIVECPDYNTNQRECGMTIHIKNPTKEPRISKLTICTPYDLQRYLLEMTDGILDFAVGHGWDYTYHSRYGKHLKFIVDELYRNPQSRRAVISVRDNEVDSNCDDPACLNHIQFFIREGKLDMDVLFRSNDVVKAYFMNAFALIRLQEIISEQLNIPVGTYTHRANSAHCYERDFNLLDAYVKRINDSYIDLDDLFFSYEDDYKDLMIDEVPKIMKLVDDLKVKYSVE